jgi:hypothetical protein
MKNERVLQTVDFSSTADAAAVAGVEVGTGDDLPFAFFAFFFLLAAAAAPVATGSGAGYVGIEEGVSFSAGSAPCASASARGTSMDRTDRAMGVIRLVVDLPPNGWDKAP